MKTGIGHRSHLTYTIQGAGKLLVRTGWSCQVPAHRAMERDDDAVVGWVKAAGLQEYAASRDWLTNYYLPP